MKTQQPLSEREQAKIGPLGLKRHDSVEFAYQLIEHIKTKWQLRQIREEEWAEELRRADEYRIYDRIPPEKPYGSLDNMLKAEIGVGADESRRAIREAEKTTGKTINAGDGPLTKAESANSDYIRVNAKVGGTAATYLTRRIARDHPAILERGDALISEIGNQPITNKRGQKRPARLLALTCNSSAERVCITVKNLNRQAITAWHRCAVAEASRMAWGGDPS